MKLLIIELQKEKRTGIVAIFFAVGILGAVYAFVNFYVRKDTLLSLPFAPMDVLLTQLYGMIMVLNLFGIVVAACIIYSMEFRCNAIRKIWMLPVDTGKVYLCKFLVLTVALIAAIMVQGLALVKIGLTVLPSESFQLKTLLLFTGYSFLTSMPVLSFLLLVSSRSENIWIPLGIGVVGFLSGLALATSDSKLFLIHPFILMMRPAVAMSAQPESIVVIASTLESILFLLAGLWMAKNKHYE